MEMKLSLGPNLSSRGKIRGIIIASNAVGPQYNIQDATIATLN